MKCAGCGQSFPTQQMASGTAYYLPRFPDGRRRRSARQSKKTLEDWL